MIETIALQAGYPGRQVLRDVSLSFPQGAVSVLLGPNGCGKSTLIKTVLGLQPKLGGQILFDGVPIEDLSVRQVAQKAAYLAQSRPTPNITARRMVLHGRFPYLSYPRRYRPADLAAAEAALRRADGAELADRAVSELSGGQRQKVYLAMALAQDTGTVFLDEPTTFLDIRHQLDMMALAWDLAREGKAVVLVLHDLALALRTADRIAVMEDGVLRQVDAPEALLASGVLEEVFQVKIARISTPDGPQYFIS